MPTAMTMMKNMVQCLISICKSRSAGTFAVSWATRFPGFELAHACVLFQQLPARGNRRAGESGTRFD